jgi:hypothetical protein
VYRQLHRRIVRLQTQFENDTINVNEFLVAIADLIADPLSMPDV